MNSHCRMDQNLNSANQSPSYHSQRSIIKHKDLFEVMKNEKNRFSSFNGKWPLDFIDVNNLVKCGFFYLLTDDKVQCAFCKLILAHWEVGDEPLDQHKKFSPKCHFLSKWAKCSEPEKTVVTPNNNFFYTSSLNSSTPQRAKVPRMSDVKKRLSSYKGWSPTMISIEDLALSGLFYTGVNDVVTCFSCGISLSDWEPYEEPMTKHSKLYPYCVFLHFVASGSCFEQKKTINTSLKPCKPSTTDVLKSEIVCRAKEIFPSHLVEEVIEKHLIDTGEVFSSLQHLCDKVLEHEEKKLKIRLDSIPNEMKQSTASCRSEVFTKTCNTNAKSTNEALLCKICLTEELGITFQPCGHLISCNLCSQHVSKCPVCRLPIQKRVKTYLS